MTDRRARILLLCYGNPGRLDDGLGPALAERLEGLFAEASAKADRGFEGVTVDSDYQLQVEDAARIADHDVVIFADASVSAPAPFTFRQIQPVGEISFTTHSVSPGALLALAHEHFDADAAGYVLAIRGYEFDGFGELLSEKATSHLTAAVDFLAARLPERRFDEVVDGTVARSSSAPTP